MQAIRLAKKYPQFKQDEIYDLINQFRWVPGPAACFLPPSTHLRPARFHRRFPPPRRKIDVDEKGSVDKAAVISAIQSSGDASYDQARETLKGVSVDASGRVELEDWVQLHSLLKEGAAGDVCVAAGV